MITPVEVGFYVHRHAPFPTVDPFTLTDELTGVPTWGDEAALRDRHTGL